MSSHRALTKGALNGNEPQQSSLGSGLISFVNRFVLSGQLPPSGKILNTTMWHNLVWIGGIWLVALVFAWLICHWRGYNAAAWAFAISAFCLGLFVGAENTTHGRFKVPFLSGHHHRHLIHHTASR